MTLIDRMRALVGGPRPAPAAMVGRGTPRPDAAALGQAGPLGQAARPVAEVVAALRAAGSVLDADRVLAGSGVLDWAGIVAAHRDERFGRVALRALAGRADCVDPMLRAMIEPFEVAVTRGSGRRDPFPREVVFAALARIAEVRPRFFVEAAGTVSVDEMIAATNRFDLLAGALGRFRGGHERFWPAVGRRVRPVLGRSPARWLVASARLPGHRGTLRGFLRRMDVAAGPDPAEVDLRLLCQAPDTVIAAVLDAWDDGELERVAGAKAYSWSGVLDRMVLRGLRGGARPRHGFGWWRPRLDDDHDVMTLWPVIGGAILEGDVALRAERRPELRRRLVWARPVDGGWARGRAPRSGGNPAADRDPAVDLVAELRGCGSALRAEAVLCATLPDDAEPGWALLVEAHRAVALPAGAVRALLDRPGFPPELLDGLADHHLIELFEQHRGAARTALRRLPWNRIVLGGAVDRVGPAIAGGTLTPADILTLGWPAKEVLGWILTDRPHWSPDPDRAPRAAAQQNRIRLARDAAAAELGRRLAAAPVDWTGMAERLPDFTGPVTELIGD